MRRRAGMTARLALAALALLAASPSRALDPEEMLADPVLERRARAISTELRCLVCQNQSIDDSDAPLARDLRGLVRERLRSGETDEGVRTFLVSRYGDFVLLRPPFAARTLVLWLGPLALFALAAGGLVALRRRPREGMDGPLTPDEEGRLRALVGREPGA